MLKPLRRLAPIALTAALCAGSQPALPADPYTIDVVLPLTGPAAFIGKAHEISLTAAERTVNAQGGIRGRPIRFQMQDDRSDPQVAVQLANAIVARHPALFIDGGPAATCLATAPLVKDGPVEYCLSPAIHPAPQSWVFSSGSSTRDYAVSYYRYFRAMGWKRIALISSTDASGQDADQQFAGVLKLPENAELQLVDAEHFNGTDLSVAAQMARIKAADPQVVIAYAPGTPFGTLLHGIRDGGITVPIATGGANMASAVMKQYADVLPSDLLFPSPPGLVLAARDARTQRVYTSFLTALRRTGTPPDSLATIGWDPAMIVVDALRALGPDAGAEQLRAYLERLHDYVGVAGTYDFRSGDQRGLTPETLVVTRWDAAKGTWTALSAPGGAPLRR